MNDPIDFKFYRDKDGFVRTVAIDIIDLQYICHLGLRKDTVVFEKILETLNEIGADDEENH